MARDFGGFTSKISNQTEEVSYWCENKAFRILSIHFTSDYEKDVNYNLITDKYQTGDRLSYDFEAGGNYYLQPEWVIGNRSNPIVHQINDNLKAKIVLESSMKGAFSELKGDIYSNTFQGVIFGENIEIQQGRNEILVESEDFLATRIGTCKYAIRWEAEISGNTFELGRTGDHVAYLVFDQPISDEEDGFTRNRYEMAVKGDGEAMLLGYSSANDIKNLALNTAVYLAWELRAICDHVGGDDQKYWNNNTLWNAFKKEYKVDCKRAGIVATKVLKLIGVSSARDTVTYPYYDLNNNGISAQINVDWGIYLNRYDPSGNTRNQIKEIEDGVFAGNLFSLFFDAGGGYLNEFQGGFIVSDGGQDYYFSVWSLLPFLIDPSSNLYSRNWLTNRRQVLNALKEVCNLNGGQFTQRWGTSSGYGHQAPAPFNGVVPLPLP